MDIFFAQWAFLFFESNIYNKLTKFYKRKKSSAFSDLFNYIHKTKCQYLIYFQITFHTLVTGERKKRRNIISSLLFCLFLATWTPLVITNSYATDWNIVHLVKISCYKKEIFSSRLASQRSYFISDDDISISLTFTSKITHQVIEVWQWIKTLLLIKQ